MNYEYDNENFTYIVDGQELLLVNAHCDQRVLHSPGHCEYCDRYPEAQAQRSELNVAFTDDSNSGTIPCPALNVRTELDIHSWAGNQPHGPCVTPGEKLYLDLIERPASKALYNKD